MPRFVVALLVSSLTVASACTSAGGSDLVVPGSSTLAAATTTSERTTTVPPLLAETFVSLDNPPDLPSDTCKISDITPSTPTGIFNASSGFPVPAEAVNQTGTVRLFVIPVETDDHTIVEEDLEVLQQSLDVATEFFAVQSYGKARLEYLVEPKENWVRLAGTAEDNGFGSSVSQQDFSPVMQKILEQWQPSVEVSENDLVLALLPHVPGVTVAMVTRRFDLERFNNVLLQHGMLLTASYSHVSNGMLLSHELGHSWLRLEDLYHFQAFGDFEDYMGVMDIMANVASPNAMFSSWSRWRAGWIEDDEILCIDALTVGTYFIGNLEDPLSRVKAVVVPISDHSVIVIDVRPGTEPNKPRAFVYSVDTSKESGNGPYRRKHTFFAEDEFSTDRVTIRLLNRDNSGVVVQVGPTP